MEVISAACAMEWSVELEKGLRSKKPGQPIASILQLGRRIERWSKEPSYPVAVLNMFGLVHGVDRLFANTILLRLADAFRSGDKHTRLCVLKIFRIELKHQREKGKRYKGILAKERIHNCLEMLKRVKIVFDTGDVESRALALCLLGCWAVFAKDSAEIRYMILSSLRSCHVLEVKASAFAAGCFSELSEDFASVVLEMMINMVTSPKISPTFKLAGVRTFSRLGCSSLLASRAYKTGKKLVSESSEDDFTIEMLVSLSKLASKSMFLISEQVDFLLAFISERSASSVQAMALRCLNFLVAKGVIRLVNSNLLKTLFHVLDGNFTLGSQCVALKILRKIFRSPGPIAHVEISEIVKLVKSIQIAAISPVPLKRSLALHLLVDISLHRPMPMEIISTAEGTVHLPSSVVLLLIDRIEMLVKPVLKTCGTASELKKECKNLLNLVIDLVEDQPATGVLAFDRLRCIVESVLGLCIGESSIRITGSSRVNVNARLNGKKYVCVASKLVCCMYKIIEFCLGPLSQANTVTDQMHQLAKLLLKLMDQSSSCNQGLCIRYLFILPSCVTWSYLGDKNSEKCNVSKELGTSNFDCWVDHERLSLQYMKKLMAGENNWAAYSAGKRAACQGAWFAVAFMSGQLRVRVQSNSCAYWLKSLALFAQAECTILLLFGAEQVSKVWIGPCREALRGLCRDPAWNANPHSYIDGISEAYTGICSAAEMLACATRSNQNFYFQRWFLSLRSKVLQIIIDVLKFLSSNTCNGGNISNILRVEASEEVGTLRAAQDFHLLSYNLTRFSFQLSRLVREFDLLGTSFMGMDSESHRTISRLALGCSFLAFCTGFVLYYPNLYEKCMLEYLENSMKCSHFFVLKDVIERLQHIDSETSDNLKVFLTLIEEPDICFHCHPRAVIYKAGLKETETLAVSRFAVLEVLRLREEAKGISDQEASCHVSRTGVQFLSEILKQWMRIPFQTPSFFFQVRPCAGAELFAFHSDTRKSEEISILPGFHLALNLCLQMKDKPPNHRVKITKLYCILACRPSYQKGGCYVESKEQTRSDFRAWESVDAVDLNEKLMLYVREGMKKKSGKKQGRTCGNGGLVWSCVSFEANERGQGFSTCLLDVSAFPVGSYKIKWCSCCMDSQGSYWSLVPLNTDPHFTVKEPPPVSGEPVSA